MTKQIDYLIVGQGLAGTLVAHEALKRGQQVMVLDARHRHTASRVAAGIINPITGRRFVKSWLFETLFPVAKETYQELEQLLEIAIFSECPILRVLFDTKEENEFYSRSAEPAFAKYLKENPLLAPYDAVLHQAHEVGEIMGGKVNIALLMERFQAYLKKKGCFWAETMDYTQLTINEKAVFYKNVQAQNIIFCEGIRAEQNPYFSYLPFNGAKGEVLIVQIPNFKPSKILKHKLFLVPLQGDIFWVGSNYAWNYEDALPTSKGKQYLQQRLERILTVPFKILEHRAAIRPTVKDRRPFIGRHPHFDKVFIFNGLGTKGSSLGPYFSRHFWDFLEGKTTLLKAIDVQRVMG